MGRKADWKTIALIVGLFLTVTGTLGLVMPWDAASKEAVAAGFAENDDEHRAIHQSMSSLREGQATINGKLDVLIEGMAK